MPASRPGHPTGSGADERRGIPWLRLTGALLALLAVSVWLLLLEAVAPAVALLLSLPVIALAGPAWTSPGWSGTGLVLFAGILALLLARAVAHPLLVEGLLVAPLGCAGALLLADALRRRDPPGPGRTQGSRGFLIH